MSHCDLFCITWGARKIVDQCYFRLYTLFPAVHCCHFANKLLIMSGLSRRCQTGRITCCCLWCCVSSLDCCCVPTVAASPLRHQLQNLSQPCPRATATAVLKGSKAAAVLVSTEKHNQMHKYLKKKSLKGERCI